jgi:hypothetical protein
MPVFASVDAQRRVVHRAHRGLSRDVWWKIVDLSGGRFGVAATRAADQT